MCQAILFFFQQDQTYQQQKNHQTRFPFLAATAKIGLSWNVILSTLLISQNSKILQTLYRSQLKLASSKGTRFFFKHIYKHTRVYSNLIVQPPL